MFSSPKKTNVDFLVRFRFLFLLFISLLVIPFVSAGLIESSLSVEFVEEGTVTHYYGKYHVVQISGTVTLTNPTDATYFGIRIPFKDTVLNYKQIMTDGDVKYVYDDEIFIITIGANESRSFNYRVTGISNDDPIINGSVLRSIIDTENVISFSDIRVTLLKAPLEIPSEGGRVNTRVVTVRVENPTAVDVDVNSLEVIKTPSVDVTDELDRWVFPISKNDLHVPSGGVWEDDIIDTNAFEGEVYWADYDLDLYKVIFDFDSSDIMEVHITLLDQFNRTTNESVEDAQTVFILKEISSSVVQPGDVIEVMLTLLNFGSVPEIIDVSDVIPEGFEFFLTGTGTVDGNIFTDSRVVGAGESLIINYSVKYVGDGRIGLDFFEGATLFTSKSNVTSSKLSFIREYLPKEKLFVQKKVTHVDDGDVKIEIVLKNIGQSVIRNIILKEPLNKEDRFEQISRSFIEKGVWSISEIDPNKDFVVEYITSSESDYNVLPNIFGIDEEEVYKTLITDTVLKNIFQANRANSVELLGVAFVVLFIVLMALINFGIFEKFKPEKRVNMSNKINDTHNAIADLKNQLKK